MPARIFVSYCHRQGSWVWDRLVPVLKAGGAEVLIDRERFEAGRGIRGQMDATQDAAEIHVLILSPEYLASEYCVHEMERAIARDPQFENGSIIPVKRVDVALPAAIDQPNPLYIDLTDDRSQEPWDLLVRSCGADLGVNAASWLAARDEIRQLLRRGQSVNFLVRGKVAWRELIADLQRDELAVLALVNLEQGATASRRGLVTEMLRALGMKAQVPPEPEDLGVLDRLLTERKRSLLALTHFDLAANRPAYGVDLFSALRYLVMDRRQLTLLVQSRQPFASLLPADHPLSGINLQTVELCGRR
jgi:hypothetical protein